MGIAMEFFNFFLMFICFLFVVCCGCLIMCSFGVLVEGTSKGKEKELSGAK